MLLSGVGMICVWLLSGVVTVCEVVVMVCDFVVSGLGMV